jgi:hypothetical protein
MNTFNSCQENSILVKSINDFFQDFEKMIFDKSISPTMLIKYKSTVDISLETLLKEIRLNTYFPTVTKYKEYLMEHIINIKRGCNDINYKFSNSLINNQYSIETFINYFEKLNKIRHVLEIVFGKILQESNKEQYFNHFIYKSFIESVFLKNSTQLISNVFRLINKIRVDLKKSHIFEKLSNGEHLDNISDTINNKIYTIKSFFQALNDLEKFINVDIRLLETFDKMYKVEIKKMYSVFNSLISSIDEPEQKMDELKRLIIVETTINDNLFNNQFIGIFCKELLVNNIDFIVKYFDDRLTYVDDNFIQILKDTEDDKFTINKFLSKITNIPNFTSIYYKIFDHNIESVEKICNMLGIRISNLMMSCPKEKNTIKTIFMTLNLLRNLEENLMFGFLPNHATSINNYSQPKFNENINLESVNKLCEKIHNSIFNSLKEMSHDKICKFIFSLCQTKENNREKDPDFNDLTTFLKSKNILDFKDIIMYIIYCIPNKDDLELLFKRKLVKRLIYSNISNINISKLKDVIHFVSNIDSICLNINRKLLIEYERGKQLSIEYNNLFQNKKNMLDLCYITDGLTEIKHNEYSSDKFYSKTFISHLEELKNNLKSYHGCKFEARKLEFVENFSSFDLVYNIGNYNLKLITNYKQSDILFLMQNEYYIEYEQVLQGGNNNEFNRLDNIIKSNKFIKFLIEKKVFTTKEYRYNDLTINLVEFNEKFNLKKNRTMECYKLNLENDKSQDTNISNAVPKPKYDDNMIVFYRSDYIKSFVIRYCKSHREEYVLDDELFTKTTDILKNRFELDKPLYQKTITKLVDDEYLSKHEENDITSYKYMV